MSDNLMKLWILAYLITAVIAGFEKNWWRVMYYVCASGLTVSVLGGMK